MADLTQEQYDQLPDFLRDDYAEKDGAYQHAGFMKVKATADGLDARLKAGELEKKEYEATKAAEITAAIDAALADAIEKGDTKEQLRLEREKLDDKSARIKLDMESLDTIRSSMASEKQKNIIDRLSNKATSDGKAAFKRLVKDFVVIDPVTREATFLNEDGSASSLSEESFYTEFLSKNSMFKPLLKAIATATGGGDANGDLNSSAIGKAPHLMTSKERTEFATRDPAGFKKAFKL